MKVKTKLLSFSICVLLLAGCGPYRDKTLSPVIDLKGIDRNVYAQDLAECQSYAKQIEDSRLQGAVVGGLIGGIFDALDGDGPAEGVVGGALLGGASGASDDAMARGNIVRKCLAGRGYKILY